MTDHVKEGTVALHIPLLGQAVSDAELRLAGIDDLEVQRQAYGSNPSWVSEQQLGRIDRVLESVPEGKWGLKRGPGGAVR